jgi:predicted nucleic-acid-binding Zn-ribbon protein
MKSTKSKEGKGDNGKTCKGCELTCPKCGSEKFHATIETQFQTVGWNPNPNSKVIRSYPYALYLDYDHPTYGTFECDKCGYSDTFIANEKVSTMEDPKILLTFEKLFSLVSVNFQRAYVARPNNVKRGDRSCQISNVFNGE